VEQQQLSKESATVERTKEVEITEVTDAIALSPTITITAGPMAIIFMHITGASHATCARMDTRSKLPRATPWVVANGAMTSFDVEGHCKMKINKLTIIIIVQLKLALPHHKNKLL
jgi:hypothetical protein